MIEWIHDYLKTIGNHLPSELASPHLGNNHNIINRLNPERWFEKLWPLLISVENSVNLLSETIFFHLQFSEEKKGWGNRSWREKSNCREKKSLHVERVTVKETYTEWCFSCPPTPCLVHPNAAFPWNSLWRGVRSDIQLSCTETRFQKCSQSGTNGYKHPMSSISMTDTVISCKKIKRNTQNIKIADFTM